QDRPPHLHAGAWAKEAVVAMAASLSGSHCASDRAWTGCGPDAIARPESYDAVLLRRNIAYLVAGFILFGIGIILTIGLSIFGVITFGLGFHLFPLLSIVPIAYATLLIGGPHSATFGMRLMDVQVRSWGGERPNLFPGLIMPLV